MYFLCLYVMKNSLLNPIPEIIEEDFRIPSPNSNPVESEKKPASRIKSFTDEKVNITPIPTSNPMPQPSPPKQDNSTLVDTRLQEYINIYNKLPIEFITQECISRGLNGVGIKSDLITLLAKDDISKVGAPVFSDG